MFGFRYAPADAAVETLATLLAIRRDNHADRRLLPPRRRAAFRSTGCGSQQAGLGRRLGGRPTSQTCAARAMNVAANH